MYIPFEQLPAHSRVWIYQADRPFSNAEAEIISGQLKEFCSSWMAHGNPLETSFTIEYFRFIILSVNENLAGASGCSIDGSVRVLKTLASQLGIDFFGRTKVAFLIDSGIQIHSIAELPSLFKSGVFTGTSVTFNNLVADKSEFENNWKVPIEKSWLAKYLPKGALSV